MLEKAWLLVPWTLWNHAEILRSGVNLIKCWGVGSLIFRI